MISRNKHPGTLPIISVNSATADGTKFVYTCHQRHRVRSGDLKDSGNNLLRTFYYTYDVANHMTEGATGQAPVILAK